MRKETKTPMNKIDRRHNYFLVIDTETANTTDEEGNFSTSSALVYDLGFKVCDTAGNTYERYSFIIYDVFFKMKDVMQTAYYADKIPQYMEDYKEGKRICVQFMTARKILTDTMKKYETNIVCAHNARFDYGSLNATCRYLTKSQTRYFFPYGTEIWDSLKMASDTICKQKFYREFCEENGFMTKHKTPRPKATAEVLYRYITHNVDFEESHTGAEDVDIETEIVFKCIRQHKKMRKKLWEN